MTNSIAVVDTGPVRQLIIDRPERRNALDAEGRQELLAALRKAENDRHIRALVLSGAGDFFCAGADISSIPTEPILARAQFSEVNEIVHQLVNFRLPLIAAVEGGAYGLGLSLACLADIIVASESAKFCASFAKIGLIPDTGLFYTLPRRVNSGLARRMILTAENISSHEAHEQGLCDDVVPDGKALERALQRATELVGLSAPMIRQARDILSRPNLTIDEVLELEMKVQVELLEGADFAEGRKAFTQRTVPSFKQV